MPIAIGTVFNPHAHAIAMPDGRVLTTAGGVALWYKNTMLTWHEVGAPHVGGEQRKRPPMGPTTGDGGGHR